MLLTHFFIFTFPKKKFQNDSKRLTVIKYFIFDWQMFYKHDIIALCWTVSDLWLAVRGWEWQRRPGEEWAVWSGASHSSSAADTCGPALWMPRWCPGLAASHGRCWPSSSRAHALPSAQGSGPHLHWHCYRTIHNCQTRRRDEPECICAWCDISFQALSK